MIQKLNTSVLLGGVLTVLLGLQFACSDSKDTHRQAISFEDSPGQLAVGKRTNIIYRDTARDRDVTATWWYPTDGSNTGAEQATEGAPLLSKAQQFPLVVLIHGIEDNGPGTWPWLAPHLASHGYIVITPSMGSTFATASDLVNHPADISFLIDTALGLNAVDGMFREHILQNKIAVGGFSFGGAATYRLAYDAQHQDPRIKAAMIIAGIPSEAAPVNPAINLFTIYGTEDPLVRYDVGLNIYEAADSPKTFLTLTGGGHLGFTRSDERSDGASMDQGRQETLTRLAVFAYLTSLFAADAGDRLAASNYLYQSFNEEYLDATIVSE